MNSQVNKTREENLTLTKSVTTKMVLVLVLVLEKRRKREVGTPLLEICM